MRDKQPGRGSVRRMSQLLPLGLRLPADLTLAFAAAATKAAARVARHALPPRRRRTSQVTLKPGAGTPLWNELATAVQAQLRLRGERARLARILGLPRQRLHDILRTRRHMPDAERTLLLLVWLHTRADGRDLA